MSVATTVVDLGVGNLGNVVRALAAAGGQATVTADPSAVRAARRIVLPGVGAFRPPRERLRGDLENALRGALPNAEASAAASSASSSSIFVSFVWRWILARLISAPAAKGFQ